MPRRVWRAGAECDQAASLGRLQVFRMEKQGSFSLMNEVESITRRSAAKVPRPPDSVAAWRSSVGGDAVLLSHDAVVLQQFKAWQHGQEGLN